MILLPATDVWREPTEAELLQAQLAKEAAEAASRMLRSSSLLGGFNQIAMPVIRKKFDNMIEEMVTVQPMPEPTGPSEWMKAVLREKYDQSCMMDTERPIKDQEDALAMAVAGIRSVRGDPPEPKFPKPSLIPSLKERVNLRRMRKGKS